MKETKIYFHLKKSREIGFREITIPVKARFCKNEFSKNKFREKTFS